MKFVQQLHPLLVLLLLAPAALASSIKGYSPARSEDLSTKGQHRTAPFSPVEQQKLIEQRAEQAKGRVAERIEQLPAAAQEQLKIEDLKQEQFQESLPEQQQQQQLKEEVPARVEETKGGKYEAKPQLSRDELAKGQKRLDEYSSKGGPKIEQQRQEEPAQVKIEQQRELPPAPLSQQKEEKFDQQSQYQEPIDLKLDDQQRKLEEPAAFVQPIPPLGTIDTRAEQLPIVIEQQRYESVKGRDFVQAPLAEAEPYAFDYQIDGQSRRESGDTKGVVRGQYTLQGSDGSSRIVDYIADHNGFRASVNTNEFGTEAKSPASIALASSQPNAEDITLRLEGKTKEDFAAPQQAASFSPASTKTSSYQAPIKTQREESHYQAPAVAKGSQEWPKRNQRDEYQAKGQRLTQQHEDNLYQEQPAPASKSLASEQPRGAKSASLEQTRASFESATAHRAYKQTLPATTASSAQRKQAPGHLLRQLTSPAASVPVRAPVHAPVARAYARQPVAPIPNPRVSFYSGPATGPISYDEEIPSFIEPEQA